MDPFLDPLRDLFFFLSCAKLEGMSGRRILQSSNISLPHGLLSRNYADKVKKWFLLPPTDTDVQEAHNLSLTGYSLASVFNSFRINSIVLAKL